MLVNPLVLNAWADTSCFIVRLCGSLEGTDDMQSVSTKFPLTMHDMCAIWVVLLGVCLCLGQWLRKGLIVNALWISWLASTIGRPSGMMACHQDQCCTPGSVRQVLNTSNDQVSRHLLWSRSITSIVPYQSTAYHWDPLALAHSEAQPSFVGKGWLKIQVATGLVLWGPDSNYPPVLLEARSAQLYVLNALLCLLAIFQAPTLFEYIWTEFIARSWPSVCTAASWKKWLEASGWETWGSPMVHNRQRSIIDRTLCMIMSYYVIVSYRSILHIYIYIYVYIFRVVLCMFVSSRKFPARSATSPAAITGPRSLGGRRPNVHSFAKSGYHPKLDHVSVETHGFWTHFRNTHFTITYE